MVNNGSKGVRGWASSEDRTMVEEEPEVGDADGTRECWLGE